MVPRMQWREPGAKAAHTPYPDDNVRMHVRVLTFQILICQQARCVVREEITACSNRKKNKNTNTKKNMR